MRMLECLVYLVCLQLVSEIEGCQRRSGGSGRKTTGLLEKISSGGSISRPLGYTKITPHDTSFATIASDMVSSRS